MFRNKSIWGKSCFESNYLWWNYKELIAYECQNPKAKEQWKFIGGRYKLGKKIWAGSFGEIFEGTDIFDGSAAEIKLEHNIVKYPQLLLEAKLLKYIP